MLNPQKQDAGPIRSYGVITPIAEIAARETHIDEEIQQLTMKADLILSVVEDLELRLARVASPLPPSEPSTEKVDDYRVPVANSIRHERRRIDAAYNRLISLRDRLEL